MHEIIIGRSPEDFEKYGTKGTGVMGKHFVGEKRDAYLTNPVRIDLARPHIIGIFGKRGTGKSHTLGVIAEELSLLPDEISANMACVIIDPMGIYWSMKNPNERDIILLSKWGLKPKSFDVQVLVPEGQAKHFRENEIPYDKTFAMRPSELDSGSWALTFGIELDTEIGILLEKTIKVINSQMPSYDLHDMIEVVKKIEAPHVAKQGLINRFALAHDWGIFSSAGTSIHDIAVPGKITVLDISQFGLASGGWSVRSLVVALIARKILEERMKSRRLEELHDMEGGALGKSYMPFTWMLIDEAHQFLPSEGVTVASGPLLQWVKIGREPGVSLVLATQMPYKLHNEAISQCDLVITHRLTSRNDIEALANIMQSYMRYGIPEYFDRLPREKGSALILDDNSERLYEIRMRPRMSWHAGGSPIAIND